MTEQTDQILINPQEVDEAFRDCLYEPKELEGVTDTPEGCVVVEGLTMTVGFHPERLEAKRETVTKWLSALPHTFRKDFGGWSFLEALNLSGGSQWTGSQMIAQYLFCLGMGLGLVECQVPRDMWIVFPGGVPYYAINI